MTKDDGNERKREHLSDRELLIRLDERVEVIHGTFPKMTKVITRHDRELLIAKVVIACGVFYLMVRYPNIAEALAKVIP